MISENQGILITILLVVAICVMALVAVVYTFIITLRGLDVGSVKALEPDREVSIMEREVNYNFAMPQEVEQEVVVEEKEESVVVEEDEKIEEVKRQEPADEEKLYNFNFDIPEKDPNPSMKSIVIPSIKYNSPIIISDDGDKAVDYGAWHYPSNHPMDGEAIFLCHRRFFRAFDAKSCWNLDKVKKGDSLFINYSNGKQAYYKVDSVAVASGQDINIYHASSEHKIKLISCAKENGRIGSSSHRIIVIATLVE